MNDAWFRYICGGMQSAQSAYFGAIYYLLNIRLKYINLKAIIVLLLCICLDFCKYVHDDQILSAVWYYCFWGRKAKTTASLQLTASTTAQWAKKPVSVW